MCDLINEIQKEKNELKTDNALLNQKIQQIKDELDNLQEKQEIFNQFMQHSPIPIFFKDDNIRYIHLSSNCEHLLGRPINDLLGKTMDDIFPSDCARRIVAEDEEILMSGKELIIKEELNRRVYMTHKFPIFHKGETRYIAGYAIDITDQKQAYETLNDSEEKFRKALYIYPDPVCINSSADGKFIMINRAFTKITGYSESDIVGKTEMECSVWRSKEDRKSLFARLKENGEVSNFEAAFSSKDGKFIYGSVSTCTIEINGVQCFFSIIRDITKQRQTEEELKKSLKQVRLAVGTTIQVLVSAVEEKDRYTAGHQRRTTDLARSIATELGLSRDRIEGLRLAGVVHDIGKLSVPSEILNKPGSLSILELALVKGHAQLGYDILKNVKSPWPLADIIYQHHERIDGSGYPQRLRGEEIMVEARILAVADVIEAMCSHRPYRPALGIYKALEEIEKNKGIIYDSDVVDACLKLFREKGFQFKYDKVEDSGADRLH